MKIKTKNDYNFKVKLKHVELVLIKEALEELITIINPTGNEYEKLNHILYDCDEFNSNTKIIDKINKMYVKIKNKLDKINPY